MRLSLKLLPMLILLMLCFPIGSGAVISSYTATPNRDVGKKSQVIQTQSTWQKVHILRKNIRLHRARTWYWQDQIGVTRYPTTHAERKTRSIAYLNWINRRWNDRQKKVSKLYHSSLSHIRVWIHQNHPCLAGIIDLENSSYDPTVNYGGGHYNTSVAYGLPQATPGTKLAYYSYTNGGHYAGQRTGTGWATSPWIQLKWMKNYAVGRYGGECQAYNYRITYHTY